MSCKYINLKVGDLVKLYPHSGMPGIVTRLYVCGFTSMNCATVLFGRKKRYLLLTEIELVQRIRK